MKSPIYTEANYTVAIEVAKSPNTVFNHIIHDVSKFWPEEFEGDNTQLNAEFIFRTGDSHYSKNQVVEFVPDKKIVWLVTESLRKTDNFEWTGSKMIFELTNKENNTLLQFTYDGIVLENEYDRLIQLCDMVIQENLYNLITNKSFTTNIEVAKSPEYVFNCLKEVSKWWSKDFEGNSAKLHDEFVICHPGSHYSKHQLIEMIPYTKVVWLVTESELPWLTKDPHEWTNTTMIFDIIPQGDKTVLHFTHEGLVPEKECYARCTEGWTMIIKERLFNFITSGKTI